MLTRMRCSCAPQTARRRPTSALRRSRRPLSRSLRLPLEAASIRSCSSDQRQVCAGSSSAWLGSISSSKRQASTPSCCTVR
uniref:Uncharacterized protein n=1 Tax=Arundo donax TaxID=35708 RepID=A0A0A9C516_ARUDO